MLERILKPRLAFVVIGLVALALAGCGGSSAPPVITSAPAGASPDAPLGMTIDATLDSYSITLSTATATAPFTVVISNVGDGPHAFAIEDADKQVLATTDEIGRTKSGQLIVPALAPGQYTYFCPLPGHRREGMVGTLTVQ